MFVHEGVRYRDLHKRMTLGATAGIELSDFAHPKAVAEPSAAFGQRQLDDFAVVQPHRVRGELGGRPFLAGELVVGQNGDALGFEFGKKIRRVALAVDVDLYLNRRHAPPLESTI